MRPFGPNRKSLFTKERPMSARLEAQCRELQAKAKRAEACGDRETYLKCHRAWCELMKQRLA
jgi:hypothetical protein